MKTTDAIYVEKTLCKNCIEALRRILLFNKVEMIEFRNGEVVIGYDPLEIDLVKIKRILKEEKFILKDLKTHQIH